MCFRGSFKGNAWLQNGKSKVYGDENPALTGYWCCQWRRYHQLYLATTATQFSNVGDYPIAVTLGLIPNYSVVSTNGTLSVTQKYCCVADGKSKYTGMKILRLLLWLLVLSMAAIPSTLQLLPQFSNVGQYPIDVTLGYPNYSVVSTNGTLSVTQKYCCNNNSDGKSKVYGDENPALTVVTGTVNGGDTINYTQLLPLNSHVGYYPDVTLGDNPNYVVSTNGILT
jgi:hypothetical protein